VHSRHGYMRVIFEVREELVHYMFGVIKAKTYLSSKTTGLINIHYFNEIHNIEYCKKIKVSKN